MPRPATISIGQISWITNLKDVNFNNFKPVITVNEGEKADQPTNVNLPDGFELTKEDYNITPGRYSGDYIISLTEKAVQKIEKAIDPDKDRLNGKSNYLWKVNPIQIAECEVDYLDDDSDIAPGSQFMIYYFYDFMGDSSTYKADQMKQFLIDKSLRGYYALNPSQQDIPYTAKSNENSGGTVLKVHLHHVKITVLPNQAKSTNDKTLDGIYYPAGVDFDDLNKKVTRTIYVYKPDGTISKTIQTAHISREATIDMAELKNSDSQESGLSDIFNRLHDHGLSHNAITYSAWSTDNTDWSKLDIPTIDGYKPSRTSVELESVNGNTKDSTINITYTANQQKMTWKFVDDDDGYNVVQTVNATGATGTQALSKDIAKLTLPTNYVLAEGSSIPTEYTFQAENPTVEIHVKHATEDVTNSNTEIDPNSKNTVNNMTHFDRTYRIIAREPDGKEYILATQEVHLSRTATKDLVTNKITYGQWSGTFNGKQVKGADEIRYSTIETSKEVPTVAGYEAGLKDYWFKTSDGSNAMEYLMYSDHDYVQTQIDPTFLFSAQNHKDINGYKFYFSPMDACLMTDDKYFIGNNKQFATGEFVSQVPSQNFYIDYQANDQAMNIIYKDAAGNVIKTDKVTGKTDQTVDTKSTLPAGWKIADSSAVKTVPTQITFKGAKTADVTITVDHAHKTITPDKPVQPGEKAPSGKVINGAHTEDLHKTVTRTITINDPHTGTSQRVQKVELTRSADVDKVTGNVTYGAWSTDQWDAVKVPTVAGYTTNQPSIPQVTIDGDTKDQKVVINYTANNGTQTINYVDAKGNQIGSQVIKGKTDQTVDVTVQIPAGWTLSKGQSVPSSVQIAATDTPITVTVEHGQRNVTPDKPVQPGEKTPSGKDINGAHTEDLHKTVTRTITINDPHTGTSQRVQKVELTRSADVDEVTGNVTYGAWSTDQWDAVKVPAVAGYTANQPSIPQVTIDGDTKDQKVVINYTANNGTQTINYVDAKGNKIGSQVINGKTDQKIKVTPQVPAGWVLTQDSGMPTDVTIKPSDTPINVKIEHGIKDVQPTNPVKPDEKTPDGKKIIKGAHEDDLTKTIN